MNIKESEIVVVGLGYVGLPLAMAFHKKNLPILGYDLDIQKIDDYRLGNSRGILPDAENCLLKNLKMTDTLTSTGLKRIYIVTVPTPINSSKTPDFEPLIQASKKISNVLSKGDLVVYESTVYPGATEEICLPHLIATNDLKLNVDFHIGYSPERINPGDRVNRLENISKIVSGSDEYALRIIHSLYSQIIDAPLHEASSIKVAEAAKVIENIQRDVNIALINELQRILDSLDLPIKDVIEAASTKWNFMKLFPGLVGGHCIGVDPYYMIHKAKAAGQMPRMIESARDINESQVEYYFSKIIKYLFSKKFNLSKDRLIFFGLTFKPDCEDTRNSKSYELLNKLKEFGILVHEYDPYVRDIESGTYEYAYISVKHTNSIELIKSKCKNNVEIFEVN